MAIRLRLAVKGLRNNRFFHLVAIDHRKARNAQPTELLGIYRPRIEGADGKKTLEWSLDRIKYWLSVGAVPSKPAANLLEKGGILKPGLPRHPRAAGSTTTVKSAALDKAKVSPSAKANP